MEKLLSKKQVCEMCAISPATLNRYESGILTATVTLPEGRRFPKRIRIGFRVFWVESEVQAWIKARIAEHRSKD